MQDSIQQALREGAVDSALVQARAWVARDPDDAQALRWLAIALRQSGETGEARSVIERALGLAPDDAELHFSHAGVLLGEQAIDDAAAALARTVELDPNQLGAYVMQAHLALARDDVAEANRLLKLGQRVDPDHPQLLGIAGNVALREGRHADALKALSAAAERAPDDELLRHGLGMAYMANGHHAFAEQAFRRLLETRPQALSLQLLLVQLLQMQGRPEEALQQLQALLAGGQAGPALERSAGELALHLGRNDEAVDHLRRAAEAMPGEPRTLDAALEAWSRTQAWDDARSLLETQSSAYPELATLWRARIRLAALAGDDADEVLQQWLIERPDDVAALEARMAMQLQAGMREEADASAQRIVELQPGHGPANLHLLAGLLARDPDAALQRTDALLADAQGDDNRRLLQDWRAAALEAAGREQDALAQWSALQAELAAQRAPLPTPTPAPAQWPPLATEGEGPAVAFLFGPPGSGLERVIPSLQAWFGVFRADRFGQQAPNDAFQYLDSAGRIAAGELDPAMCLDSWASAMPGRGIDQGQVIDWLPWWDNALLQVVRPRLGNGRLLYALRDPRDMLLQWLRGNTLGVPFGIASLPQAAQWLAATLQQVIVLRDEGLFPLHLLRLDDDTPTLAREVLGEALGVDLSQAPPVRAITSDLPPGHWRRYATILVDEIAVLTPVAVALGYPEN